MSEYEDEMEEHHPEYGVEHLSECAISMGWPELGCTCNDDSPDWTI